LMLIELNHVECCPSPSLDVIVKNPLRGAFRVAIMEQSTVVDQPQPVESFSRTYPELDTEIYMGPLSVMNMDDLVPWCAVGCISSFFYGQFPACIGVRGAAVCVCCTGELDACRVLCSQDQDGCCGMRNQGCPESHFDLKKYPDDWFACYSESCNCGGIQSIAAMQCAVCCCDIRISIPTNSQTLVPFIVNVCGLTLLFQWKTQLSCCAPVGELKKRSRGKKQHSLRGFSK
jgi:hypothetical protein